jgi:lipoyl(octanoyl) transferase
MKPPRGTANGKTGPLPTLAQSEKAPKLRGVSETAPLPVFPHLSVEDWGLTDYAEAFDRQVALVGRRIAGEVGDTLVLNEHRPVFTVGLHPGSDQHLVWDPTRLSAEGVALARTNRGGDITYHGPGQVTGYPIIDLAPRKDLHAYLRFLEEVLIQTSAFYGLTATRREGLTGIWVGTRKLAAIGVAVKRWVTYHGFAYNVAPELRHFQGIVPCGITSSTGTVTSLSAELGRPVPIAEAKNRLAVEFAALLPKFLSHADGHVP